MKLEVLPLVGVGPVRFGMSPAEVAAVLGGASRTRTTSLGEAEEVRDGITVRYDKATHGVVEIAIDTGISLTLGATPILEGDAPIAALLQRSRDVVECLGFLLFLDLGIAVTGFHDGDEEQRAVTLFAAGRWDGERADFTPFTPPASEEG
jgi:hypothetical protein